MITMLFVSHFSQAESEYFDSCIVAMSDQLNSGELEPLLRDAEVLLKKVKHRDDSVYLGRIYMLMGGAYWYSGNGEQSIARFEESIRVASYWQDTATAGKAYFNLGFQYLSQGQYDHSLASFLQAEKYFEGHCEGLSKVKDNIAYVYMLQEQMDQAEPFIKEAFDLAMACNDSFHIVNMHNSLGYYHLATGQYERAETVLQSGFSMAQRLKYQDGEAVATGNLSELYLAIGNTNEAIRFCRKSLVLDSMLNDIEGVAQSQYQLAQIYYAQGEFSQAGGYATQALETIDRIGGNNVKVEVLKVLADSYNKMGMYPKAIKTYEEHYALKDSLTGVQKSRDINEIMQKYETDLLKKEKKQAELSAQYAEQLANENRNFFIAAVTIAVLILIIGSIYVYQYRLRKRAQLAEVELKETREKLALERKLSKAEIETIKSQMNPHFVFNALNSIQDYIVSNDKVLASDYLGLFANLMRRYLDFSEEDLITLDEEVETLDMYLQLEKIRFEDSLRYFIEIDEQLDAQSSRIPAMLLQPFVENALKHGLLHRDADRKLWVRFTQQNQRLLIEVEDNGVGREKSAKINAHKRKGHKSFATSAIQRRVDLLNRVHGYDIAVNYHDLAQGTKVSITFPL